MADNIESGNPTTHHQPESQPTNSNQECRVLKKHGRADLESIQLDIAQAFQAKVKRASFVRQRSDEEVEDYFFEFGNQYELSQHDYWKSKTLHPLSDPDNPVFYGADGMTRYTGPPGIQHANSHGSEAPSPPSRRGRGGGRGRGGFGGWRGRGRGRGGATGGAGAGRDRGDSPDPPYKPNLGPEDKLTLSHIRGRQAELKRFFALVGAQQTEILNALVSRDLSKLIRKPKTHTKVAQFNDICDDIDEKMEDARDLAKERFEYEVQLADDAYNRGVEMAHSHFSIRVEESQREHIKGAEGDLIIFKNAHNAANDETRTEAGSDVDCYFPRYHECPEPDAHVRGYTSTMITDEKSLKKHLATYDEQAQREVIDDDVFEPLAQSVALQNEERRKVAEKEKTQTIGELAYVAEDELRKIGGYLIPQPMYQSDNPQFALSLLADASDYVKQAHPDQSYVYMPVAPVDVPHVARDVVRNEQSQLPPPPPTAPPPANLQQKRASMKKPKLSTEMKRMGRHTEQNGTSPASTSLPAIAPAPMRLPPPPPSPIYAPPPPPHHMQYGLPPPPPMMPSSPQHSRRNSQHFTFTPTQTPGQTYFAPSTNPRPYSNGTPTGHAKLHNTFVNQTVESRLQADKARENAARTQGQGAGPKGGKRILLPKV